MLRGVTRNFTLKWSEDLIPSPCEPSSKRWADLPYVRPDRGNRIHLYRGVCNIRKKSFDGLCGIVRLDFGADLLSNSPFVFVNAAAAWSSFSTGIGMVWLSGIK